MIALVAISLLLCFSNENQLIRGFSTPYKSSIQSYPSKSYHLFMAEKIGGAYEYTGPMSGGVPVEIAAMFNLKKGRKIKKGSGTNNRKSSSSSSSSLSSSTASSSSNKIKKSKTSNNEYDDDDEYGMEALERQVISKYGSKSIKESVLTPIDAEDKALQQERMASRTRFEGFGAKPLSPTRAAVMQQQPTSNMNKKSSTNHNKDTRSAAAAVMSEEEISKALFEGSRTMSQYVVNGPTKSKSSKSRDDEQDDDYNEERDDSNQSSGISSSSKTFTSVDTPASSKPTTTKTNADGSRHWDFATDFMSGAAVAAVPRSSSSSPPQPQSVKANTGRSNGYGKSNAVDDNSDFADEFYNDDENDDDGFGNNNNNNGIKKYIPKSSQSPTQSQSQSLKQDRPPRTRPTVVRTPLSTNGKMKLKPFFKDDKEEEEVEIVYNMMDDLYTNDDEEEEDDEDVYDDDEEEEEEYVKPSRKFESKQPQPLSKQQQSFNRQTPSVNEPVTATPPTPAVMYRLRAPVIPVAPLLTEKQQKQLQIKQQAEVERNEIKLQKYQEKKMLEKNEFYPFEFDDGDAKSINTETNKLFSKTSTFQDLGVTNEVILNNLMTNLNIATPTRIQELSIPVMLKGRRSHSSDVNSGSSSESADTSMAIAGGGDVVMQAHTGSGKTLAFLLPLVDYIDTSKSKVQAIVMASSRELVSQIGLVAESLFNNTGVNVQTLIGGANVQNQIQKLKTTRPHVLVATPGRLAELVFKLEKIKLGNVRVVIIDEADQMLCEPYLDELDTLLDAIPMFRHRGSSSGGSGRVSGVSSSGIKVVTAKSSNAVSASLPTVSSDAFKLPDIATLFQLPSSSEEEESDEETTDGTNTLEDIYDESADDVESNNNEPQVVDEELQQQQMQQRGSFICLASATSTDSEAVKKFAYKYMRSGWESVVMDGTQLLPPTITHGLISIPRIRALEMLRKFLNAKPTVTSAIVFVNDPYRVQIVCDQLIEMSLIAAPLHGESSKEERKDVLNRLRDGRIKFVVSTELAARGLDIPELSHVVNFDLPTDCQHYIHRAGRCGRAGRQGLVMNFANSDTKFVARRFGKQLNVKVMDCEIRSGQVFLKKR